MEKVTNKDIPEVMTSDTDNATKIQPKDTYYPRFAIERKAGEDFVKSITYNRDRFRKEIKRAEDWDSELLVLIEAPKKVFQHGLGFMEYRDVKASQIFGTVNSWERYYNVEFQFGGTRHECQKVAYNAFYHRLGSNLLSD
jgi:hypothetical protein